MTTSGFIGLEYFSGNYFPEVFSGKNWEDLLKSSKFSVVFQWYQFFHATFDHNFNSFFRKIWKLKKVTEKVRKIDRQPKPVAVKKESDEMSIHEMKSGKRKSMDNNENPPKKQKIDQNIVTKKIEQRDFKIFGSDKFSKSAKK